MRCALLGLLALAVLPASASAIHNDEKAVAQIINQPGTSLGSFNLSHSNEGDPTGVSDEFTECGGVNFGSSVWYRINPDRNGRFNAVVQGPNQDLEPAIVVFRVDETPEGTPPFPCNVGSPPLFRADLPEGGGFRSLTGGRAYFIQIGGATPNNNPPPEAGGSELATEGSFNLFFTYDPNTDNDALFDSEDRCDTQPGPTNFQGCPNSDGDSLADIDELCDQEFGSAKFRGCPDYDGDNRVFPDDLCPYDSAARSDPNKNGCLALDRLIESKLVPAGIYRGGRIIRSLTLEKVPTGARVRIRCRRSRGKRNCGSSLIRKATAASVRAHLAKTIRARKLRGKRLPFGSKISILVTKRGATGWYRSYKVVKSPKVVFKRTTRCTNHGSKKLRKSRCK